MALYKYNTSKKASLALTSISGLTKEKTMNETRCQDMMEARGRGKGREGGEGCLGGRTDLAEGQFGFQKEVRVKRRTKNQRSNKSITFFCCARNHSES